MISAKVICDSITHMDRDGRLWSGNMRGWIQHYKQL